MLDSDKGVFYFTVIDMEDLLKWVSGLEKRAHELYTETARIYSGNKELHSLLTSLAAEEMEHYNALLRVRKLSIMMGEVQPTLLFDNVTRVNVEAEFLLIEESLARDPLSPSELLEKVVSLEHSEMNDIFTYTMETMEPIWKDLVEGVGSIDSHLAHIENFVDAHPEYGWLMEVICSIPAIWNKAVLIVGGDVTTSKMLKAIFEDMASVDIATNGEEALAMMEKNHYMAILSDVEMEKLDGIGFYEKVAEDFPASLDCIIFFAGSLDEERSRFFNEKGLTLLSKPGAVSDIKNAIVEVLRR